MLANPDKATSSATKRKPASKTAPRSQPKTRPCRHCGAPFELIITPAATARCSRFTLTPQVCEACVTGYESRLRGTSPDLNPSAADDKDDINDAARAARLRRWQEKREAHWRRFICPPGYQGFHPDKVPEPMRPVMDRVLSWRPASANFRGIGLMGASFHGKSMLLHELGRLLYCQDNIDIHITHATRFASLMSSDITDSSQARARRRELERCRRAPVLLFDDFGKARMTPRVEADLYDVLETRRQYARPLLTTTNSTGAELKPFFSEDRADAILNRLRLLCEIVRVP